MTNCPAESEATNSNEESGSQSLLFEDFKAHAESERWSKDHALRVAFDWMQQAKLIELAQQQAVYQCETLLALNDLLIELLKQSGGSHLLTPEVAAQYTKSRVTEMQLGHALIGLGLRENAGLAVRGRQREAALNPRPRQNTHGAEVTRAMRSWRAEGKTLEDFIDAALVGSVDGVCIKKDMHGNPERFIIECDCLDVEKKVARSTLRQWWGKAA
jgi:hypothetical protein